MAMDYHIASNCHWDKRHSESEHSEEETPRLAGLCVFVVEDEPIVALDLVSILEGAGALVLGPALNLAQAQSMCQHSEIAAAVLDLRLGSESVLPVAAQLFRRDIPILFHTGHGAPENLGALWPGCEVVTKPASSDSILMTLVRLIRRY
jgi:CheY-like chemotaxis protein